jgi:DinB superfamily
MKSLSMNLTAAVDSAESTLLTVTEEQSAVAALPGGWSRKQLIGHLIDSACNNHQRFVRAVLQDSVTLPGYDQAGWSRAQFTQDAPWSMLVALWASYNRYLAHVIAHLPDEKLDVPIRIGSNEPVTLRFVAEDYLVHLSHHLAQIGIEPPERRLQP